MSIILVTQTDDIRSLGDRYSRRLRTAACYVIMAICCLLLSSCLYNLRPEIIQIF